MIVISSAELRNNMKKYLDIAKKGKVIIQRGRTETFVLTREEHFDLARAKTKRSLRLCRAGETTNVNEYLEPDEDFARAITMDELLARVKEDIHEMFKTKGKK